MTLEEFLKKHPKLIKFVWGEPCPKCKTYMTEWAVEYDECPKCHYKKWKKKEFEQEVKKNAKAKEKT